MKFELNEMTMNEQKVTAKLLEYLNRLMQYSRFDRHMVVRVFVDEHKDFCAFESVAYNIQFTNNSKKLSMMITSPYEPVVCSFDELRNRAQELLA